MLDSTAGVKAFYDIDTPITVSKLRTGDAEYLRRDQIPGFDVYFSFTGGPMLHELQTRFGARRAVPLYCSFDPDRYGWREPDPRYKCDFSYMGTYAPDRQGEARRTFLQSSAAIAAEGFSARRPAISRLICLGRRMSGASFIWSQSFTPIFIRRLHLR